MQILLVDRVIPLESKCVITILLPPPSSPPFRWSIDATRFGNVSRLISRGDEGDANLAPVEFADPRALPSPDSPPNLNRIALVAIRDIDQDEELVWA
jgi:hypothetical protein